MILQHVWNTMASVYNLCYFTYWHLISSNVLSFHFLWQVWCGVQDGGVRQRYRRPRLQSICAALRIPVRFTAVQLRRGSSVPHTRLSLQRLHERPGGAVQGLLITHAHFDNPVRTTMWLREIDLADITTDGERRKPFFAGFLFCVNLNKFLPGILEVECRESELYTATCRHGGNTVVTFISPVHRSAVFLFRSVFPLSLKNDFHHWTTFPSRTVGIFDELQPFWRIACVFVCASECNCCFKVMGKQTLWRIFPSFNTVTDVPLIGYNSYVNNGRWNFPLYSAW